MGANVVQLPFPSVDTVALNNFKRCIDAKDLQAIEALLDANPRYLVNYSSDGPTILRQGGRYNAVICAVLVNAPTILSAILKRINSLDFIRRCYPNLTIAAGACCSEEEEEDKLLEKRNRFLDAYLNTPDKVMFNTPLHFACRGHHLGCIQVLLNYVPTIDLTARNKVGKTALEMVTNATLRPAIEQLFENTMFVTVLRNEEDLAVRVNPPLYGQKSIESVQMENRRRATVSAIAGPMSPKDAELVYQALRSPKHCTRRQVDLRMVDPVRGLEKVARDLSISLHVPCKEYWPFLGGYFDITSPKGLDRLEEHLKQQLEMQSFAQQFEKLSLEKLSHLSNNSNRQNSLNAKDGGDKFEKDIEAFQDAPEEADSDDDDDGIFYTAPSSPIKSPEAEAAAEIYMTGPTKEKVDEDVLAVLEMAFEQGTLKLEDIKNQRPHLFGWLTKLRQTSKPKSAVQTPVKIRLFKDN